VDGNVDGIVVRRGADGAEAEYVKLRSQEVEWLGALAFPRNDVSDFGLLFSRRA
jgi:hypothetical protein